MPPKSAENTDAFDKPRARLSRSEMLIIPHRVPLLEAELARSRRSPNPFKRSVAASDNKSKPAARISYVVRRVSKSYPPHNPSLKSDKEEPGLSGFRPRNTSHVSENTNVKRVRFAGPESNDRNELSGSEDERPRDDDPVEGKAVGGVGARGSTMPTDSVQVSNEKVGRSREESGAEPTMQLPTSRGARLAPNFHRAAQRSTDSYGQVSAGS